MTIPIFHAVLETPGELAARRVFRFHIASIPVFCYTPYRETVTPATGGRGYRPGGCRILFAPSAVSRTLVPVFNSRVIARAVEFLCKTPAELNHPALADFNPGAGRPAD